MTPAAPKAMSIEVVAASFSEGLNNVETEANLNWLRGIHTMLKEGGMWGAPNIGTVYQKSGDGFLLVLEENNE